MIRAAPLVAEPLYLRPNPPEPVRLVAIVDQLNAHHERDRMRFAASGLERGWKLKAEFLSQRYTTLWTELLTV